MIVMIKHSLKGLCIILLLIALFTSCESKPEKESIVIGASRSLTGPIAIFEQVAFGPIYKMWVEEVNADGGIYVEEYGKKLPIELIVYDDESDIDKMVRNIEKLITEDEVDLLLPPAGTSALVAITPIVNKYGYLMISEEGAATELGNIIADLPYIFSVLNFSTHNQIPVLADLMEDAGVETAAIVYLSDVFGIEYSTTAETVFTGKGIEIVMEKSIPTGIEDMSPIIQEAKMLNADAFLIFAYPDENILSIATSLEMGFNPKLFITGPGVNYEFFIDIFGVPVVEGLMGFGAWNEKSSPEHKELADKITASYGRGAMDWWGHNVYYASLQILQQAIETAGTLDNDKLKDIIASETFTTVLGNTWFDDHHMLAVSCYAGQIGQWQNGIFEVIGPSNKATADYIYPKPPWPAPPEE
jgi:branched-chain amino acid transport system substrate-binding protein